MKDMTVKIKPKTYYKLYCNNYVIFYTGNKWVYQIAYKNINEPIIKYITKYKWGTIKEWQEYIKNRRYTVKKISTADLFLEML